MPEEVEGVSPRFEPREPSPPAEFQVLEPLASRMSSADLALLERRLTDALLRFPELEGRTVTVGRLKPSKEYVGDPLAVADSYNLMVYFSAEKAPANLVIYHELTHLAIRVRVSRGDGLPHTSEEFTSIYAVAKMDAEDIDIDNIAYLGTPSVPKRDWPGICQQALEYRENHRNYIQKCKEWLKV